MCDYLDNFNFDLADNSTISAIMKSATNFMKRAESFILDNQMASVPVQAGAVYHGEFMQLPLLKELKLALPKLKYMSTGVRQPGVCLFGKYPYVYNKATANLKPIAFHKDSCISRTLELVNKKLDTNFNSVLVNKYCNKNTSLNWHKDDEPEVDQTESIATLSIGSERNFLVADSPEEGDRGHFSSTRLANNSVFVMQAGFQDKHCHKVERGILECECGVRYSLTFRRLLPRVPDADTNPQQPDPHLLVDLPTLQEQKVDEFVGVSKKVKHNECVQSIIFGSSLTKGLDKDILSKPGKRFKVFCNPGAKVRSIIKDVEDKIDDGSLCLDCVENIFFVCGGNDAENIRSKVGLDTLSNSFNELINVVSDNFLYATINMISLIPRRLKDSNHLGRILSINETLSLDCSMYDNCRYIDIFSNFLKYKKHYYTNYEVYLNENLYIYDELHFTNKGNSVLGKVIMGVTYNPY